MRVGIFTETFLPQVNGVVTAIRGLTEELEKLGHEVFIFTTSLDGGVAREKYGGSEVYRFRSMYMPKYPEYRFFLPGPSSWSEMKRCRLDVLHSRSPFTMGIIAKMLSNKLNLPLIGTLDTPIEDYVHYMPLGAKQPFNELLFLTAKKYAAWYYSQCDTVTTPSEVTMKRLERMGCKSPVVALSNGVDTSVFRPSNAAAWVKKKHCHGGEAIALHLGRITAEKRVLDIIEAAKIMAEKKAKVKIIIAGRGPLLPKVIEAAKGMSNVEFLGYLKPEDLRTYYASADMFITASPVETQGIVALESLASGTPVIAPDAGALPEAVKDGKNGLLFTEGKPAELAEKIIWAMENNFKKKVSSACVKSMEIHSMANVGRKVEKLYGEMIENIARTGKFRDGKE